MMGMLIPALLAMAAIAADQWSKAAIVSHYASEVASYLAAPSQFFSVPSSKWITVLPGVVHWTFQPNTGAAFSVGAGKTWFFILVTLVFFGVVVYALRKKWFIGASLWGLALVVGGAVGNLIDRVARGFVVDMIEVEFIRFPVFNVADCCICIGAAVIVLAVLLEDKKHEADR